MRFEFEGLGRIQKGAVELGDLTLICGRNNSGKTYASYAIHCFLRNFGGLARANVPSQLIETLQNQGAASLNLGLAFEHRSSAFEKASERFKSNLSDYFSVDDAFFEDSSVIVSPPHWADESDLRKSSAVFSGAGYRGVKESLSTDLVISAEKKEVQLPDSYARSLFGEWIAQAGVGFCVPSPFAITSERTGVALFYKDLDLSRNRIIEKILQAGGKEVNLFDLVLKNSSRYALPVRENIDAVRGYELLSKQRSFLAEDDKFGVLDALEDLIGGGFVYEDESLTFTFKVKGIRKKQRVPIYVASSAVKSLFLLSVFIRHVAEPNMVLIIDEPELNLHPVNQRKIAGLLVRLVNSGVRVLITTHSDFIIREISARIALACCAEVTAAPYMRQHRLTSSDLISPAKVQAFSADLGRIDAVRVSEMGLEISSINDEISHANSFFEDALLLGS